MICIYHVDDNDDDYVKYTLQLSWFTEPETRPEPDPEPGLLTITRPEPDPKSKSAIRQALLRTAMFLYRLIQTNAGTA